MNFRVVKVHSGVYGHDALSNKYPGSYSGDIMISRLAAVLSDK